MRRKTFFVKELEFCMKESVFKIVIYLLRKDFEFFFQERCRQSFSLGIIKVYKNLKNRIKDTIFDRIMNINTYTNDNERAADISFLLIVGSDTISFTIAWILKELTQNTKEQQKLWDSLSLKQKEDWSQSETLRKIMKEGMRLHPVAALQLSFPFV
jgi:hypothetical protein